LSGVNISISVHHEPTVHPAGASLPLPSIGPADLHPEKRRRPLEGPNFTPGSWSFGEPAPGAVIETLDLNVQAKGPAGSGCRTVQTFWGGQVQLRRRATPSSFMPSPRSGTFEILISSVGASSPGIRMTIKDKARKELVGAVISLPTPTTRDYEIDIPTL